MDPRVLAVPLNPETSTTTLTALVYATLHYENEVSINLYHTHEMLKHVTSTCTLIHSLMAGRGSRLLPTILMSANHDKQLIMSVLEANSIILLVKTSSLITRRKLKQQSNSIAQSILRPNLLKIHQLHITHLKYYKLCVMIIITHKHIFN